MDDDYFFHIPKLRVWKVLFWTTLFVGVFLVGGFLRQDQHTNTERLLVAGFGLSWMISGFVLGKWFRAESSES